MKQTEIGLAPEERIVSTLEYFKRRDKTYNDWLNDHNQDDAHYKFIDWLFQQNLLCISGLEYVPMSEGRAKHTALNDGRNISKIIFVTKDGYSFLTSYQFNQRSLELNQQMKILTTITMVVAFIALIVSITALFKR